MRVGNFALLVVPGRERDGGHIVLKHGVQYALHMSNTFHRRCDATVTIDGKEVGTFRLNAGQRVVLERPVDDTGKFTFYRADTNDAAQAGVAGAANESRGLIQVRFRPEKRQPDPVYSDVVPNALLSGTLGGPAGKGPLSHNSGHLKCDRDEGGVPTSAKLHAKSAPSRGAGGQQVNSRQLAAGITGLSGESKQQFHTVAELDYDTAEEVVISVRLVAEDDGPRELKGAKGNPIPIAVS